MTKIVYFTILMIVLAAPVMSCGAIESDQIDRQYSEKPIKTAKERLSKKADDEQRVNNCKVPVAKRGIKKRLNDCLQPKPFNLPSN